MTEPEELDEDLFADLYDGDDIQPKAVSSNETTVQSDVPRDSSALQNSIPQDHQMPDDQGQTEQTLPDHMVIANDNNIGIEQSVPEWQNEHIVNGISQDYNDRGAEPDIHGTGIKEDGKMFIGGLNWETTDQSLKDYFSQFGEVQECTVMRDGATGRSRGFGFLTFRDPRTVNVVMVKEHYLDGKIIDPKRAIPRDEQERTSKIFVGGVSQDATEQDFKEYFMQYGRVVDATLMIDKDTGRPRGFGFVTFDSEAAVDATLQGDLTILGKPIEVKKAQPRGNMREEDDGFSRRGGRRGGKSDDRFRENDRNNFDSSNSSGNQNQVQNQNQQSGQGIYGSGMTPQMMAQYWQRMQQYFAQMQQQLAMTAAQGGAMNQMGMGGMNPAMMQQMQAMQQVKQMQAMQQQMGQNQGSQSPHAQSPLGNNMQGLNPAMIQQMQQLQQMQMQSQQSQGTTGFGGGVGGSQSTPAGAPSGPAMGSFSNGNANPGGRRGTPGYNAQDQLLFEQQKYEQQQARRAAQEVQQVNQFQPGGPTSWEGMYDDVPQPNMGGGMGRGPGQGGFNRQMSQGSNSSGNKGQQQNRGSQGPQSAPPANAPTGPKNHGVPGANYRGGGRGSRGGGFHPYARK